MKKSTKLMSLLLAVLMIAVLPASVLAAETGKVTESLTMAPTFEQLKEMFPQAKISEFTNSRGTVGLQSMNSTAVPTEKYVEYDGFNEYRLDVFSDGSYISYGTIVNQSRASGSAYMSLGYNAYMYMNYTYTIDGDTAKWLISSVSDGDTENGNVAGRWTFFRSVKESQYTAYRNADLYELDDVEGGYYYVHRATLRIRTKSNGGFEVSRTYS